MSLLTCAALAAGAALFAYVGFVCALLAGGRRAEARAWAGFLPDCAVLLRRLMSDPRVPRRHRSAILAALCYVVMPLDLVPEFIPVIGHLDDALVVALALRLVVRSADSDVVTEHWPGPERSLGLLLRLVEFRVLPRLRLARGPHWWPSVAVLGAISIGLSVYVDVAVAAPGRGPSVDQKSCGVSPQRRSPNGLPMCMPVLVMTY